MITKSDLVAAGLVGNDERPGVPAGEVAPPGIDLGEPAGPAVQAKPFDFNTMAHDWMTKIESLSREVATHRLLTSQAQASIDAERAARDNVERELFEERAKVQQLEIAQAAARALEQELRREAQEAQARADVTLGEIEAIRNAARPGFWKRLGFGG